jgi:ABC-type transport system involved in multi-copper enzyme maturation permease subunit
LPPARLALGERLVGRFLGRRLFAVGWLTMKAAFRYRLFQILILLLLGAVIGLPTVIKHDGTAQGFTQILLTYTLGTITTILGFATLWLGCGTLARDVEECQIQVVAVKPIARWQIWLGKWLGILALNTLLLAVAGTTVYGLLQWRASQLPPDVQTELRGKVLVARASIKEAVDLTELEAEVDRRVEQRFREGNVATLNRDFVRAQIRERVKAEVQVVAPGMFRRWVLDFGLRQAAVRQAPLFIRTRFFAAQNSPSGTYFGLWEIGPPEGRRYRSEPMSLAPDTFHEFALPAGLLDDQGRLVVDFQNHNDLALLFPLDDGLEVLYREGGFAASFVRGLGIILCWLALLAAIGLAAASFLSFPVAAFVSLALLIVGFSTGTLRQVIEEGGVAAVNSETGRVDSPSVVDRVAVPVFKGLLAVINLVQSFSPIDSLSTGRSVTWGQLGLAVTQIIVLMSGLFGAAGIYLFTRRELATAQGT